MPSCLGTEPCLAGTAHHAGLAMRTESGHQACPWLHPGRCSPTPGRAVRVQPTCCSKGHPRRWEAADSCSLAELAPLLPPPARKISSLPQEGTYREGPGHVPFWQVKSHLHHPWPLLGGSPDCSLAQLPGHGWACSWQFPETVGHPVLPSRLSPPTLGSVPGLPCLPHPTPSGADLGRNQGRDGSQSKSRVSEERDSASPRGSQWGHISSGQEQGHLVQGSRGLV